MLNRLKGYYLTLKVLGIGVLVKEVCRRILKCDYHYKGITINSSHMFRFVKSFVLRGYKIYGQNGEIIVSTEFGDIGVDATDRDLLYVLLGPLEDMYGIVNVKNAVVVDIGAFIGETTFILFA